MKYYVFTVVCLLFYSAGCAVGRDEKDDGPRAIMRLVVALVGCAVLYFGS